MFVLSFAYSKPATAHLDVNKIIESNDIQKIDAEIVNDDYYLARIPVTRFENGLVSQEVELRYKVSKAVTFELVQGDRVINSGAVLPEMDVSVVVKSGEGRSLYARYRMSDDNQVTFDGYLIKDPISQKRGLVSQIQKGEK